MLLHLIEHFVTEYSTNTTIQQYLNTTFVHIMPSMNPDGYDDSMEGDCDSVMGRYCLWSPGLPSFKNGLECDYPRSTTERSEGPTEQSSHEISSF